MLFFELCFLVFFSVLFSRYQMFMVGGLAPFLALCILPFSSFLGGDFFIFVMRRVGFLFLEFVWGGRSRIFVGW